MNAIEALKALKDGKKVKSRCWADRKAYIELNENKQIVGGQNEPSYIWIEDLASDEWELYDDTEYFDFFEAMKRIKAGKRVSNTNANSCGYVYKLNEDNHTITLDKLNCSFDFIHKEINSDKWFEVE